MTDEHVVSDEDLYEQALAEAGKLDATPAKPDDTEHEQAAEALQGEAQSEGLAPEGEDTTAKVDNTATVDTTAQAAAAEEFFPGYGGLNDEAKAFVQKTMADAAKAEEYRVQAGRAEADRRATVGKLAPLQKAHEALMAKQKVAAVEQTDASKEAAKAALAKFQKDYPDEAEALLVVNAQFESFAERTERENAELREQVDRLAGKFEQAERASTQTAARNKALAQLDELHPDRAEINASQDWAAWVQEIDPYKLDLLRSGDPEATAAVITDFKRDRELARLYSGQPATPPTPAQKPLARTVADPNPTTRRTTVTPRSNSTDGMDEEEKYEFYLRQAGHEV